MIPQPDDLPPRIRETLKAMRKQSLRIEGREITPYASAKCKSCWASGVLTVNGMKTVCGCAMRRFRKENASKIHEVGAFLEWLPKPLPEPTPIRSVKLPWYRRLLRALLGPRTPHT
jgi:hypothetical protein